MKKYIQPSIEVIKLQTEDAILTGSGDKTLDFTINAGEQTESAGRKTKAGAAIAGLLLAKPSNSVS